MKKRKALQMNLKVVMILALGLIVIGLVLSAWGGVGDEADRQTSEADETVEEDLSYAECLVECRTDHDADSAMYQACKGGC